MIMFLKLAIQNSSRETQRPAEAVVAMSSMLNLNTYAAEASLSWGEYEANEEA